jgi:phage host-nuclease inhibitor protein Gam
MKSSSIGATIAVMLLGCLALAATAQDFQKTYSLGPGARVSVKNVSGDIAVTGYQGRDIIAVAFKEGPDRNLVQVEDQSTPQAISLSVRYPQNTQCNASVRFELRVPSSMELNFDSLSNASGNVTVESVTGSVRARTASGNVTVREIEGTIDASSASGDVTAQGVVGTVNARTASGNVDVELRRQVGGSSMKFSSASGNVTVKAPANLDAEVEMATASGSLKTDFPLSVEDRHSGSGRKASGRLGAGASQLKISTASGNVHLVR